MRAIRCGVAFFVQPVPNGHGTQDDREEQQADSTRVSTISEFAAAATTRTREFRNRRGSADTTDDYDEAQCHSRGGNEIRVGSFARIPLLLALRLDTLTGGMQVHIKVIVAEEQTELSGADVGRSTVDRNVVAAPFSCYP